MNNSWILESFFQKIISINGAIKLYEIPLLTRNNNLLLEYSLSDYYVKELARMSLKDRQEMDFKIDEFMSSHKSLINYLAREFEDTSKRGTTFTWASERITRDDIYVLIRLACLKVYLRSGVDPSKDTGRFVNALKKFFRQDMLSELRRERSAIRDHRKTVTDVSSTDDAGNASSLEYESKMLKGGARFGVETLDPAFNISNQFIKQEFREYLKIYINKTINRNASEIEKTILSIYDFLSSPESVNYKKHAEKYLKDRGYQQGSLIPITPLLRSKFGLSFNKAKNYNKLMQDAYKSFQDERIYSQQKIN